jgi:Uma2 family endonuclease
MNAILEELKKSPQLPRYAHEIQRLLEEERKRRDRFYDELSEERPMEFINGEVIVHSPVRLKHNQATQNLLVLIQAHVRRNDLGLVTSEKTLVCLTRNDYEPDICFWGKAKSSQLKPDQTKFPAPDFVAEVLSESTEAVDRGVKFEDYAAHHVGEYWLVDADARAIEQYTLSGEVYRLAARKDAGSLRSAVIAGLEVPVAAVFDANENQRALRAILV